MERKLQQNPVATNAQLLNVEVRVSPMEIEGDPSRIPEPLLLFCPIIPYWLSRLSLKAHRGELYEDPITLAIRDPFSYAVGSASSLAIAASVFGIGI